jgi:hypothetical protein
MRGLFLLRRVQFKRGAGGDFVEDAAEVSAADFADLAEGESLAKHLGNN